MVLFIKRIKLRIIYDEDEKQAISALKSQEMDVFRDQIVVSLMSCT